MTSKSRERIEKLVAQMPGKVTDSELSRGLSIMITDSIVGMVEQMVSEQVTKIQENMTINPQITIPEIKIPPATINVKLPERSEQSMQRPVKSWDFQVHRHNNGLIDTISATAIREGDEE